MIVAKNKHLDAATAVVGGKKNRAQSLLRSLRTRPSETYHFVSHQNCETESAVLVVMNQGSTATIAASEPTSKMQVENICCLIQESIRGLRNSGCSIAQTVLPVNAELCKRAYSDAGFDDLATLQYMERKHPSKLHPYQRCGAVFRSMANQADVVLENILLETYKESLDCPLIHGLREINDIIQGHRSQDHYDPNLWSLAEINATPAGVLLLNISPEPDCVELAYLGVAPNARGIGLGDALVNRAVEQSIKLGCTKITLAVDSNNFPATSLYSRWGFRKTGTRAAMICRLC